MRLEDSSEEQSRWRTRVQRIEAIGLPWSSETQRPWATTAWDIVRAVERRGTDCRACSTHPGTDAGAVHAGRMVAHMREIMGNRASGGGAKHSPYGKEERPSD